MKKLAIFLGTLICTLGIIALLSGQIPTILPVSNVTEDIIFEEEVTVEGILTASGDFATPYDSTYTIAASGGDYTTIQAALTANATADTLFLVYPDTYVDDTINFTANNQCVKGVAQTPQQHITTTDAGIVNFGAYTGCKIENIKMTVTAATTAIDTVTGTGSLNMRWCHIGMTVNSSTGVQTRNQPSCIGTTGTFAMSLGTVEYTNERADADGTTAIKAAVRTYEDSDVTFRRVEFDIAGAGQSFATMPFYSQSEAGDNPDFEAYRVRIVVADNATTNAIGFAYLDVAADTLELHSCDMHVTNTGANAFGAWLIGSGTLRSEYNHIHVEGSVAKSFSVAAGATVISQFDDIVAADGTTGTGTITMVSSEADGALTTTGLIITETGYLYDAETTATPSAAFTVDWTAKHVQRVTITGATLDITFTDPAAPCKLVLVVVQGDGNDTIDWTNEASILFPGAADPTLSTGSGDIDMVTFYFDGTNYLGAASYDFN